MRFTVNNGVCILAVLQVLFSCSFATPSLGIRADFLDVRSKSADKHIQSYSGIIKFHDGTVPLDKTKMTDAKLLHLCVLAYNEMVNIWRTRNQVSAARPGAMAAIAYGDTIYFASSLRAQKDIILNLADVPKGSVREYMDRAMRLSLGPHKHGGGCSEINCIELLWTHNGKRDPDKGPPAPRVAIWLLPGWKKIDTKSEINAPPCKVPSSDAGYGCADIVAEYGLDPINSKVAPDAAGEDDWEFSLETNPRPPCTVP